MIPSFAAFEKVWNFRVFKVLFLHDCSLCRIRKTYLRPELTDWSQFSFNRFVSKRHSERRNSQFCAGPFLPPKMRNSNFPFPRQSVVFLIALAKCPLISTPLGCVVVPVNVFRGDRRGSWRQTIIDSGSFRLRKVSISNFTEFLRETMPWLFQNWSLAIPLWCEVHLSLSTWIGWAINQHNEPRQHQVMNTVRRISQLQPLSGSIRAAIDKKTADFILGAPSASMMLSTLNNSPAVPQRKIMKQNMEDFYRHGKSDAEIPLSIISERYSDKSFVQIGGQ